MKTSLLLIAALLLIAIKGIGQAVKKDTCYCGYTLRLGGLDGNKEIERTGNVVISIKVDSLGFLTTPQIDSSLGPDCDKAALKTANSIIVQLNNCHKKGCFTGYQPNTTYRQVIHFEKSEH